MITYTWVCESMKQVKGRCERDCEQRQLKLKHTWQLTSHWLLAICVFKPQVREGYRLYGSP